MISKNNIKIMTLRRKYERSSKRAEKNSATKERVKNFNQTLFSNCIIWAPAPLLKKKQLNNVLQALHQQLYNLLR